MQKLALFIILFCVVQSPIWAQNDAPNSREDIQNEYENIQDNLQKMLEGMEGTFGVEIDTMMFRDLDKMAMPFFDQLGKDDTFFKFDTLLVQPFEGMQDMELDRENWGTDMAQIMEQMQRMMQQLDLSQMQDIMRGFGLELPEQQLDEKGNPIQPIEPKKKRKTYSL